MNVLSRLKQIVTISTVAVCFSVASISQATAAERYIVSGVESWDTLNIRSQPSARSAIIGEIPADGQNVNSNGQERGNGRSTWIRITYNGVSGWVSKRYLATDYSFNNSTTTVVTNTPSYTPTTSRTGSIYDAGDTKSSVYVGPGNGLPAIKPKRQTQFIAPQVKTGNSHSHPANRCTRSISHSHAGPQGHSHRYSCQGQATQQQQAATDQNSHTHPRNQFSNAVTHSHASSTSNHRHNYGQNGTTQTQQPTVSSGTQVTHIHPQAQYNAKTTHTHSGGASRHLHDFLLPPAQRAGAKQSTQTQDVNAHTHPKNQFTNSVTHSHANGVNNHSHSYGAR